MSTVSSSSHRRNHNQRKRHQRGRLLWILAALVFLSSSSVWLLVRFGLSARSSEVKPALSLLPQDPHIQAYFNQSQASVYTDYRTIKRYGDDLEQTLITAIDRAQTSIDIAVQALDLPMLAQAIIQSARRGIQVRVILENEYAGEIMPSSFASNTPAVSNQALASLRSAAIPIIDDTADGSKGSGLMHHKFVIIDSRWVLTGSANFTYSGIHGDLSEPNSRGNANVMLKIDDLAIAAQFIAEFNQMWGDGPGNEPDSKFGLQKSVPTARRVQIPTGSLALQFSPSSATAPWQNSTNGFIARTLSQSRKRIDLALFVFSDQGIANQIQKQATADTEIRALIDPSFLYRSYSEALDMLGAAIPDSRCKVEADNNPWQVPIETVGSPRLPPGDKLHHKFALIDDATVIVGSHNWSQSANTQNDETLLVIENPTVAAHFNREFQRLYHQAKLGQTTQLRHKIKAAQQRCH